MTKLSKQKTIKVLTKAQEAIPGLKLLSRETSEFRKWHRDTEIAISNAFGKEERNVKEFQAISFTPFNPGIRVSGVRSSRSESDFHRSYLRGLDLADTLLASMIDEVQEYWPDDSQAKKSPQSKIERTAETRKVFVVHGRDDSTKHQVARFIRNLGLEPVILDEQADKGRTIIAKFEEEAQEVGFAIVLLTPDDEGRLHGSGDELSARARQNVIFELGFFAGALGRNHVCAMVKGTLEVPSDYDGVVYVPLNDSDGWKMKLIREIKAAGFEVDANRLFQGP